MNDQYTHRLADLVAEQQAVRADRGLDRDVKVARLASLAADIAHIERIRRLDEAQRVNRISPLAQRRNQW
jgi:hypothetical protein